MQQSPEIHGSTILIAGYGREGKSTHQFLLNHYPNISISIADENQVIPMKPVQKIFNGKEYLEHLSDFSTVIRSPGIPVQSSQIQRYIHAGGHVTTATNIFFSLVTGTTLGITGTKGKSTTSALIAHVLKNTFKDVRLVGNIGNPMLGALSDATKKTVFVVELSSHQLEDVRYNPHVAVVLNIFAEHMDYYKDFAQYVSAKTNIVAFQTDKDIVVYDDTNKTASEVAKKGKGNIIPISLYKNIRLPKTILQGNDKNIRAAIAVAVELGVPKKQIFASLRTFGPLAHRLEYVGEFQGIRFYNDSLATVPEATIHALTALGDDVATLIAGGFDRGLDYTKLGEFLAKRPTLKTLILFPDTGRKILATILASEGGTLRSYQAQTMEQAIRLAYEHTSKGKICLLSPASASFNMFKDYAERGEEFRKAVSQMA